MNTGLAFQSTVFDIVDRNNQPWIQSRQLANALGYSDEMSVTKIYERNKDEFSNDMTAKVKLTLGSQDVDVRVFSLRGCHLVAMFARTKVAKAFRAWVLDVLEKMNSGSSTSTAKPVLPLSTTADRKPLDKLVKVWAQQSGIAHAQCWSMVNAYFNINSVSDLPVHWIPDALAFVQDRIDLILEELPKALLAAKDESATLTLFDMAGRINTEICKFRDNLSPLYREVQRVYGNKIHCECTHSHENQARRAAYDSTVHALDVIMNMAWTAQHSLNCLGNLERALK